MTTSMMLLRVIPLVSVVAMLNARDTAGDAALKCGRQPVNSKPLYAVDGVILSAEAAQALKIVQKDLYSVEIVCLNPQDSTLNRSTGIPMVSIWTATGPASHLEPTLAAILDAQDTRFRRDATFFGAVDEMTLPARPGQIQVTVERSESGWIARARIDRMTSTCVVFDGSIADPPARVKPREIKCGSA